jgi:methyl-accepting chemotaxis protein
LPKRLHQARQFGGRDADAGIAHADLEQAGRQIAHAHRHAAALRRELDRVRQQVEEDLLERLGIGAAETIRQINEIATTIASAVEEQGSATREIARNVQEAARGTQEVSSNIVGVTQAAHATGAAATQVLGAAGQLAQQAESLTGEVNHFIGGVKAA